MDASATLLQMIDDAKNGDLDRFLAAVDPNIVVYEPESLPYGGKHVGIDAFQAVVAQVGRTLDYDTLTVEEIVGGDDYAVMLMHGTFRFTDGSSHESYFSEHWRFRDGRAVEARVFWFDTAAVVGAAFA